MLNNHKDTILVLDDEVSNTRLLNRVFRKKFNVIEYNDPTEALGFVEENHKDIALIIADQRMPRITGTAFLEKTLETYPHTIKILLTGYSDVQAMEDGINKCHLYKYISKPFDTDDLYSTVLRAVEVYHKVKHNEQLVTNIRELLFSTIKSIVTSLEEKDTYTAGHSLRVTTYTMILGRALNLPEENLEKLELAGLLHDIGKIGVPVDIICKQGRLSTEEFLVMKQHPQAGKKICENIPHLKDVALWLGSHHERYDGKGYPVGLKEDQIPIEGYIISIADTYDAMTSTRSYRLGLDHHIAVNEIKKYAGTQFHPRIVEAFSQLENEFIEVLQEPEKTYKKYTVLNLEENNKTTFIGSYNVVTP